MNDNKDVIRIHIVRVYIQCIYCLHLRGNTIQIANKNIV